MIIANIVTKDKINLPKEFNIVGSMDEIIHGLPTLIIGFDYVNEHYPDFDITNMELGNNLYWTVKRNEKRDKFQQDLDLFTYKIINNLVKNVNYVFVDPIQYNEKILLKIIKKIYKINNKITYLINNMMYIYGDDIIFGIDLSLLDYMGVDYVRIKDKIIRKSSVFLSDETILIEYKNIIKELDNKVRYIPYLFSINNDQNNPTSIIHISRET